MWGEDADLGLGGWRAKRDGMKEMMQNWRLPAMWGGNAELVSASDVERECRIRVGRVADNKGRHEENAADLAFVSDEGRECRISVGQRCGERMQN